METRVAPRMRESMAARSRSVTMSRPAPSVSAPSAPRSFTGSIPRQNNVVVQRQAPNVTYRLSPSESLSRPPTSDVGTTTRDSGFSTNTNRSGNNSILFRRSEPRAEAPRTVAPDVTNRDGTRIFNSLSARQENGSAAPSKNREIYSSLPRSSETRSATTQAPTSDATPLSNANARSAGKNQRSAPGRSPEASARSNTRTQPDRPSTQSRAPSSERSSVPAKSRPETPAKSWSSRGVTGNSPAAVDSKTREPSAAVRERIAQRRTESSPIYSAGRVPATEQVRHAGSEVRQSRELDSRLRDWGNRRGLGSDPSDRAYIRQRSSVVYHDRPDLIGHGPRYSYIYRDRHDRVFSRMIWPGYCYPVYYGYGPSFCVRWVYPYYHRRYVWVSLGGWWPYDYSYARYYWYGWHPYIWHGYYPVPREIEVAPDNYYYTYNYYSQPSDSGYYSQTTTQTSSDTLPYGVDNETYARMQAIIQKQKAGEPPVATDSDHRFEAGVDSFGAGQYADAVNSFSDAMQLAPEDKVLPYAYSQALFAAGRYSEAAQVLRVALHQATPEQQGVFYPRGLYNNDDVLFGQVEQLLSKAENYEMDGDLKLLLGYQLMGIGEVEYARQPLEQACQDMTNAEAARSLLGLLDKMDKAAESKTSTAGTQAPVSIDAAAGAAAGQTQNQADSTAKTNLLNKMKALDVAAPQKANVDQKTDNTADVNGTAPTQSPAKEPNTVSRNSNPGVTSGPNVSTDPVNAVEAGLTTAPTRAWAMAEPLVTLVGASLLVGGALCLRRAAVLEPKREGAAG